MKAGCPDSATLDSQACSNGREGEKGTYHIPPMIARFQYHGIVVLKKKNIDQDEDARRVSCLLNGAHTRVTVHLKCKFMRAR